MARRQSAARRPIPGRLKGARLRHGSPELNAVAAGSQAILARLGAADIPATVIGEVTDRREGLKLLTAGGARDLPLFEQDELTKI